MKRILLIVACIIAITTTSKAQDSVVYKSVLGDSIAEWYVLETFSNGGSGKTRSYTIATEDTVILSDTIYNTYRCNDEIFYSCSGFQGIPGDFRNYDKYIRESEDRSKLYFRTSLSNTEILLMDLNLEVGDTVDTETWIWDGVSYNDTAIVVDSIYYHNDMKHIRTNYYVSMRPLGGILYYDTLQFIEGIGPNFGITYIPSVMLAEEYYSYRYTLICYYRDGIHEYNRIADPGIQHCELTWIYDGIDEADDSKASLYPNPTKDKVFITNLVAEEHYIKVVSQMGIEVKTITAYGTEIEIDLKELPNGVYNIVIVNSNGLTSKKIIKL